MAGRSTVRTIVHGNQKAQSTTVASVIEAQSTKLLENIFDVILTYFDLTLPWRYVGIGPKPADHG